MKEFSRVFIKNEVNELLLIESQNDIWHFPGGKREMNESPKECAIRETKEEVNLDILELEEVYCSNFLFDNVQWRGFFYFVNKVTGNIRLNEPDKIKRMIFVQDIKHKEFFPQIHHLIDTVILSQSFKVKKTMWISNNKILKNQF